MKRFWIFVIGSVSILFFVCMEFMIVSVPDFPYNAQMWEIQLWGEKTQWWSEVTWILLFGVFSFFLLLIGTVSSEIKNYNDLNQYRKLFFIFWCIAFGFMSFNYVGFYWHERGGWNISHGWFYFLTTWLGILLISETSIYMLKIHRLFMKLKWMAT